MRNLDFKRYTPRPKKLLRASLKLRVCVCVCVWGGGGGVGGRRREQSGVCALSACCTVFTPEFYYFLDGFHLCLSNGEPKLYWLFKQRALLFEWLAHIKTKRMFVNSCSPGSRDLNLQSGFIFVSLKNGAS